MNIARKVILTGLLAGILSCSGAIAAPVWICSITSAAAVEEDGKIGQPDLGGLERPTFLRVDTEKKEVTLLAPKSRRGEVTKIDTIREVPGIWVLTGVESGRPWSLIITDDGNMTMTVSNDGLVWSVFGNALQEGKGPAAESKENK